MKNDTKTKHQLLDEFFKLGGNYKNFDKIEILENKLNNYLKNIDKNDKQISDALRRLNVYKLETTELSLFKTSCEEIYPTIERLLNLDVPKWDFYDIRFSQSAISWTKTFEIGLNLAKKALSALRGYKEHELYFMIELAISSNIMNRLLRADFIEIDHYEEGDLHEKVKASFGEHFDFVLAICRSKGDELRKYELMALIRKGLLDRDSQE